MDPRLQRHVLGFWEAKDRPSSSELSEYYDRHYYQKERGNYRREYSAEELRCIRLRIEHRAIRALALRKTTSPGTLLDVGCGEGFVMAHFAGQGWDVAGLDFSVAGVTAMNPDLRGNVEQGDILSALRRLIATGTQFDIVWLGNVLEHVLDPVGLMKALREIVLPAGILVVTVPNDGTELHEGLFADGAIERRFWIAIPDHISYFTRESLTNTSLATGWNVEAVIGDFPIDIFLAHPGANYVNDQANGPAAHEARLRLEQIIASNGIDAALQFYSALAEVGLGRNLTAFLSPRHNGDPV